MLLLYSEMFVVDGKMNRVSCEGVIYALRKFESCKERRKGLGAVDSRVSQANCWSRPMRQALVVATCGPEKRLMPTTAAVAIYGPSKVLKFQPSRIRRGPERTNEPISRLLETKPDHQSLLPLTPNSFFARSLNSRLSILPIAFFGISSTNATPPLNCLYGANRSAIYFFTSSSLILLRSLAMTYARGQSVPGSSGAGTPTTAASLI